MSVTYSLPRSIRQTDFVATANQTVFGPTSGYLIFDVADVVVQTRPNASSLWTTVAPTVTLSATPGYATATFSTGLSAGTLVRIQIRRVHPRTTDVTRAGALVSALMERELDLQASVLQELRRDINSAEDEAGNAKALYDLFDDRYLGEKTALPALDNDGNALVNGALVSLTGQTPSTLNGMYVRRGGAWQSVLSQFLGAFVPYRYVATASQTVFSGADANGVTLGYVPNAVFVTVNGATQTPNTYTATNGTSITLGTPLSASDVVVIYSFGSFAVADTWTKVEADNRYQLSFPTTVAFIASAIPAGVSSVITDGYYAAGDGGAGSLFIRLGAAPSPVKLWHRQTADGAWWQLSVWDPTPNMLGAYGNSNGTIGNGTDDTAAITDWLEYIKTIGVKGRVRGLYRYRPAAAWDLTGITKGLLIEGFQRNGDGFVLDAGFTLSIENGNGFYFSMNRVKFLGEVSGPVLRLGRDDFADAMNGGDLDLVVNNNSLNSACEGVRFNYVLAYKVFMTVNCGGTGRPGQPTTPGFGTAIRLRQANFCQFNIHGGQANIALAITDGFNFANTFVAVDFEEVNTAVSITSANASKNVFVSGQILGTTVLDCTAGTDNLFMSGCNLAFYGGGSLGTNIVGVVVQPQRRAHITQPAVPATTVWYKNVSGFVCIVTVWAGNVSLIDVRAVDTGVLSINPQVVGESNTVVVQPNAEIRLTYTVAPVWHWYQA
jgi:hypothetical protein